jgi:hypothetical protein
VTLDVLPGVYAICRLSPNAAVPSWTGGGALTSITRSSSELSIVCASDAVPAEVQAQRGYRGLAVRGPLDFSLVGIMATLAGALAAASVSIFVVSTYDTDYLFVREADFDRATAALRGAGHIVASNPPGTPVIAVQEPRS